jgi:TolB-like protein/Tfp pilus assembly protein PilF
MQAQAISVAICPECGTRLEGGFSRNLGRCMICLLRVGFDDAEEPDEAPLSAVTDRLGNYRIQHHDDGTVWELGHGAMGVTYRAIDTSLQRPVALKLIASEWVKRGAEARERFMREARTAAALRHPNVATVYHFGIREENGQCFCAMELVEGETLETRVRRTGPLDALTTIEIALQVSSALAAAEKQGLVHRDLKPANLMFVEAAQDANESKPNKAEKADTVVKVIDFGVAKALVEKPDAMGLTQGGFVGTPAFASPEQFTDAQVDVRSDIYSLGATLWYLLTGRRPFEGATIEQIRASQRSRTLPIEQLKAARVPSRLISLLLSMLSLHPAARPDVRTLTLQLQDCRAQILDHWKSARRLAIAAGLVGIALAAVVLFPKWHDQAVPQNTAAANIPEKSIAVLPFENRSHDPDNAYFADGIQDEILTRLSKIADLKVISRTSTQRYKSAPENLSEIARELGVAHILEGSVQKTGATVRVNVQLIKAANDSHLWADTFDRNLTDVLSVESEVAKAIADQLRAKLTGQEEQVIAAKPTDNVEAYDAYLRGLAYTLKAARTPANALGAQKYLREAVRLDPKFALAWALLARVNSDGYRSTNLEPTVALREEARQAAETALTLQPNLGEAILAQGYYHYACLRDYDTAVHYFQQARQLLPSSSRIPESLAFVARRRGQWDKSESYFNEAERLDPRNVQLLTQHALSYIDLRRFPEALRKLDQVLNITPDDVDILAFKANIAQAEGDLPRAAALLAPLHPTALTQALETQVYQAILERQPAPMIARLKEILAKPDPALDYIYGGLRFDLGWAQEVAGDHAAAQETWRQARSELESSLKEQPENDFLLRYLALTNMGLGDKAAALALTERDIAANPIEKDPLFGPGSIEILARVFAKMGEPDRAIAALQKLLSIPYTGLFAEAVPLTPALLRLDPMFDPLRNDPRFQKLAASPPPQVPHTATELALPEKSIAVLPFENRSEDKANGYFTDGVQDEILTNLAKIADLRVISRTSVLQYKSGVARDLREIAQQLGVANVVEGSVQRSGNRVRVNARLVDARTDAHLWAQTYDRDLADVFAIQSEIAKDIANQLQAKLSPNEKKAIEQPPTTDLAAFDLYSRAKSLLLMSGFTTTGDPDVRKAIELLDEAVKRDPSFFDAYCQLAYAHESLYATSGTDHTPARLALAETALQAAARLRPDAGETHLARANYLYYGRRDYSGALAELESAGRTLPNDSRIFEETGYILRRRGDQEEGLRKLQRAVEFDPRNFYTLQQIAASYQFLGRYPESIAAWDRALGIMPDNVETRATRDLHELWWKGDTRPLHETIDAILAQGPGAIAPAADVWFQCALAERDAAAAEGALIALGGNPYWNEGAVILSRSFGEGLLARMTKDEARARTAFEAARAQQEKIVRAQPDYGPTLCVLAMIDAALGYKDLALEEGRRAIALTPLEKDAINGSRVLQYFAITAAWADEKELVLQQLVAGLRAPVASQILSYGALKLFPVWDSLRGDPSFEKIVASLAPNTAR